MRHIIRIIFFRFILLCLVYHCTKFATAQTYPIGVFGYPMDTPMLMSAPFGALRDNHFHSGMDIRTGEKIGLPVYAIADGYVSRIKYASGAYGKAIYITHPNGYTSVYAHLHNANGEIANYIRSFQYEQRTFEFDHFPTKDKLKVSKGQIIGWSGNSGTSTGPHLHFEIRDTKTEHTINPKLFGIMGVDQLPPEIKGISIYSLDANRPQLISNTHLGSARKSTTDSGTVLLDTIICKSYTVGFLVEAIDYLVGKTKEYSIYGLDLEIDRKLYFRFRLDRFAFDRTRQINIHIDFERYKLENTRYQKLFLDDGNTIPLYPYHRNKGKYIFTDTLVHWATIQCMDFGGRTFTCYVPFKYAGFASLIEEPIGVRTFLPNKTLTWSTHDFSIMIPNGSLYDTLPMQYTQVPKSGNSLSAVHQLSANLVPLQKAFTINIKPDANSISNIPKDKLLIASRDKQGVLRSIGGEYQDGWVIASSNVFQDFVVSSDTTPPVIRLINAAKGEVKDKVSLQLHISDNLSGIQSYNGYINGKWELFEYDAKNNLLEYFWMPDSPTGKLELEIVVSDKKNNKTTLKTQITRL
jgi:murein DD-endopeptidase MepM/ murein hydrolase activator NlpD